MATPPENAIERLNSDIKAIATDCGIELLEDELPFDPIYPYPNDDILSDPDYQLAIQPWMELAKECLRFLIVNSLAFEQLIHKRHGDFIKAQFSLMLRAAQDYRSIIDLIESGHSLQADVVLVSMIETLEFASAVVIDPELAIGFVAADTPEDANKFWHQYISKSKARKKIDGMMELFLKPHKGEKGIVEHYAWKSEALKVLGATKHPNFVAPLIPLYESADREAPAMLQIPKRRTYSVKTIQLAADACVEYANVVLLKFAPKNPSEDNDGKEPDDENEPAGFFDERWLDSYASRGHKFLQLVWLYFLNHQDEHPFNLWQQTEKA